MTLRKRRRSAAAGVGFLVAPDYSANNGRPPGSADFYPQWPKVEYMVLRADGNIYWYAQNGLHDAEEMKQKYGHRIFKIVTTWEEIK